MNKEYTDFIVFSHAVFKCHYMSSYFGISRVILCFMCFKERIVQACWRKRKQDLKNSSAVRQFPLQLPTPWVKPHSSHAHRLHLCSAY